MNNNHHGFAVTSLVLGIVAIVLSFLPIINNGAFFLGILAVAFGIIALLRHQPKGMAIAGLITGVLSLVITLALQDSWSKSIDEATNSFDSAMNDISGDNTDEILANDIQVDLGQFTVTTDEYGFTSTELPVTITNKSDESLSFDIHLECVDASGTRLVDDYIYESDLGAGQSVNEKAFTYISDDKLSAVEQGTFQIVEISKY